MRQLASPGCLLTCLALLAACEPLPGASSTRQPILGGQPVPDGQLSSVGALVIDELIGKHVICSATLVSERLLLTAAHCIEVWKSLGLGSPGAKLIFVNGSSATAGPGLLVAGTETHPEFDGNVSPPGFPPELEWKDLGLAWLAAPTQTPPMKLLRPLDSGLLARGQAVQIVGYGWSDPKSRFSGGAKLEARATIEGVHAAELWVLGSAQKCVGDSGGPTLLEVKTPAGLEPRLIGVASRAGEGCTGGSVETRTDHYLAWIHQRAADLGLGPLPCGSGLSAECKVEPAPRPTGEACSSADQCQSRLCILHDGARLCREPCLADRGGCGGGLACLPVEEGSTSTACLPAPILKAAGEFCASGAECAGGLCSGRPGRCEETCDPAVGCGPGRSCRAEAGHFACVTELEEPLAGCTVGPGAPSLAPLLLLGCWLLLVGRRPGPDRGVRGARTHSCSGSSSTGKAWVQAMAPPGPRTRARR